MRTRQRTVVHTINAGWAATNSTWNASYCSGSNDVTPGSIAARSAFATDMVEERIDDLSKPEGGTAKAGTRYDRTNKPVFHRSERTIRTNVNHTALAGYSYVYGLGRTTLQGAAGTNNAWAFSEYGVSQLSGWTLDPSSPYYLDAPPRTEFGPRNKADAVLLEDCYEKATGLKADILLNLIESAELWPSMKQLTGSLPKLARNWKRARTVINTASAAYLAWKFGVSPFVSDMTRALKSIESLRDALDAFRKGKAIRYSSADTFACYTKASLAELTSSVNYSPYVTRRYSFAAQNKKQPTVRYVLRVTPNKALLDSLFTSCQFMLGRYASRPVDLIWELVPFSFIVDWFADMRGLCRILDRASSMSPYEVLSFSRSFSYEVSQGCSVTQYSPCDGSIIGATAESARKVYKHYERRPVSTEAFGLSWRPIIGKSQAAITAALISQALTEKLWWR